MVTLAHSHSRPRVFMWVAALLAPVAWSAAVSMMFPLIDATCIQGSRAMVWLTVATCTLVALAPAAFIAPLRRFAGESAPLVRDLVLAGSIVFAMVMLVTAVPILMLDACSSQTSAFARNSSL
jgi:hypothetical protein